MIVAAFRYFATIFALGFVLGTIRTLWLAPAIGATAAVLTELPVMLLASALVARRMVTHPRLMRRGRALGIGALAFVMLMVAEALLAVSLAGQTLGSWSADLLRTPGWIGLAGQIVFGLLPWLVLSFVVPRRRGALPPLPR